MNKDEDAIPASYEEMLERFRKSADEASWVLIQAQNLPRGERRHWSSVLFIRICLICESVYQLCPNPKRLGAAPYWDFPLIASLCRNVFEAIAFFDYISTPVDEDHFQFRVPLMSLNDCVNRIKQFKQLDNDEQATKGETEAVRLRDGICSNTYFQTLDPALQKRSLAGFQPTLKTLREMAERITADYPFIWGIYDYLSTHAHSHPVSFFRVVEQQRTGREN